MQGMLSAVMLLKMTDHERIVTYLLIKRLVKTRMTWIYGVSY